MADRPAQAQELLQGHLLVPHPPSNKALRKPSVHAILPVCTLVPFCHSPLGSAVLPSRTLFLVLSCQDILVRSIWAVSSALSSVDNFVSFCGCWMLQNLRDTAINAAMSIRFYILRALWQELLPHRCVRGHLCGGGLYFNWHCSFSGLCFSNWPLWLLWRRRCGRHGRLRLKNIYRLHRNLSHYIFVDHRCVCDINAAIQGNLWSTS